MFFSVFFYWIFSIYIFILWVLLQSTVNFRLQEKTFPQSEWMLTHPFHPFLYIFYQIFSISVSQLHKNITSLSNIDRSWKINKNTFKFLPIFPLILIQVWMFLLSWKIKVWLPRPVVEIWEIARPALACCQMGTAGGGGERWHSLTGLFSSPSHQALPGHYEVTS